MRKGKKDKRRPAGRRHEVGRGKETEDKRKKIQLNTTEVQKLTCPDGITALLSNLIIKQSMLKHSALPPTQLLGRK